MFIAAIGPSKLGYAQIARNNYVSAPQNNISFTSNSASESNWLALTDELKIERCISKPMFQEIKTAYSEKGRFYHTLDHVSHMLDQLEEFCANNSGKITKDQKAIMKLAIWFHDFKDERLNPIAVDESAQAATDFLLISPSHAKHVPLLSNLIMATKYFANPAPALFGEFKFLTDLMQDLDYSALGLDWEKFKYNNVVLLKQEAEYVGKDYVKNTKGFLGKLCEQKSIFKTDWFRGRYERIARENIARLLKMI